MNALLPIPPQLGGFIRLPGASPRFISLERVLRVFLPKLFPAGCAVGLFRIIGHGIEIEEEAEDLVAVLKKHLETPPQRFGYPHMEVDQCPTGIRNFIADQLDVSDDVIVMRGPMWLCRSPSNSFWTSSPTSNSRPAHAP